MENIITEVEAKSNGLVIVGLTKSGVVTYNGINANSFNTSFIQEVTEALEHERKSLKVA